MSPTKGRNMSVLKAYISTKDFSFCKSFAPISREFHAFFYQYFEYLPDSFHQWLISIFFKKIQSRTHCHFFFPTFLVYFLKGRLYCGEAQIIFNPKSLQFVISSIWSTPPDLTSRENPQIIMDHHYLYISYIWLFLKKVAVVYHQKEQGMKQRCKKRPVPRITKKLTSCFHGFRDWTERINQWKVLILKVKFWSCHCQQSSHQCPC